MNGIDRGGVLPLVWPLLSYCSCELSDGSKTIYAYIPTYNSILCVSPRGYLPMYPGKTRYIIEGR